MNTVFLGLGSNLGDREKNIADGILKISKECSVIRKSSLYETEPMEVKDQPWFLNSVIEIETTKTLIKLLRFLKGTEKGMGRAKTKKNAPRVIDLDILFFNDAIIKERTLMIPHPRLHERRFVLEPLCEIAPKLVHPILKKTMKELKDLLSGKEKVRKYETIINFA